MRNRFFIPDFLFNVYSVWGSVATPSVRSNVSRCGLSEIFGTNGNAQFWSLITHSTKTRSTGILIFGSLGEYEMLY